MDFRPSRAIKIQLQEEQRCHEVNMELLVEDVWT